MGSRVDEEMKFDTREERDQFVKEYNEKYNNEKVVPDWYMVAQAGND